MRPRERYSLFGPEHFNDADLLALVIGVGDARQTAPELAGALLSRFGGLNGLASAPVEALRQVPGIGLARAVRLHAALQGGLRAARRPTTAKTRVRGPDDAFHLLRPGLEGLDCEELHALYVDRRGQVLFLKALTRGSDALTVVDPWGVFRCGLMAGARGVVVAHNHPSGDPTPSSEDIGATERLVKAGQVVGIRLIDHLVLGGDRYLSLAARGLVPPQPGLRGLDAPWA